MTSLLLFVALLVSSAGWAEEAPHIHQPELEVLCFKVYYSKRTFTCKQGTWDEAPADDVQVTVVWYGKTYRTFTDGKWQTFHYRHVCAMEDYYWLDGCGSADEAAVYKGKHSVKRGRWTTDKNFHRIYNRAQWEMRPPR